MGTNKIKSVDEIINSDSFNELFDIEAEHKEIIESDWSYAELQKIGEELSKLLNMWSCLIKGKPFAILSVCENAKICENLKRLSKYFIRDFNKTDLPPPLLDAKIIAGACLHSSNIS